ncbi:unnamed protein product [Parascedosporium putredinis]|uniref:DUF7730 domain-containing protein n=1 Tax=Parascedosporium putredinis TaxID=1442378 RepID=A0A9P1MEF7_9PEZI|nr:unnamed protein product [Parascedosporium putredinis]CAI8002561.1 unnamed protein product [Parascedosporium putredinis]
MDHPLAYNSSSERLFLTLYPCPLRSARPAVRSLAPSLPSIAMARRSKLQRGRPTPVPSAYPTPISSAYPTPLSSAYPSACPSEDEGDVVAVVKPRKKPAVPFRFLDLPAELRLRIYGYHFAECGNVVDLDPDNYKRIHRRLALLRTCRQVYYEASTFFYSSSTFRVFPTHPGRFFKTKKPLLARLSPFQRASLTTLELRLGPGWNRPPRGWVVNEALGLRDCVQIRKLKVFVECDPSDTIFNGFRRADGFYEDFSRNLLQDILKELPSLEVLEFDAWESVKNRAP